MPTCIFLLVLVVSLQFVNLLFAICSLCFLLFYLYCCYCCLFKVNCLNTVTCNLLRVACIRYFCWQPVVISLCLRNVIVVFVKDTICTFVAVAYTRASISQDYWGGHKRRLESWGMEVPQQGPGAEPR